MPRSEEQIARDQIASDILYLFKHEDGWLLKDAKREMNLGKYAAVLGNCRKVVEMLEKEREVKRNLKE